MAEDIVLSHETLEALSPDKRRTLAQVLASIGLTKEAELVDQATGKEEATRCVRLSSFIDAADAHFGDSRSVEFRRQQATRTWRTLIRHGGTVMLEVLDTPVGPAIATDSLDTAERNESISSVRNIGPIGIALVRTVLEAARPEEPQDGNQYIHTKQ